jgi:hypothetical protein
MVSLDRVVDGARSYLKGRLCFVLPGSPYMKNYPCLAAKSRFDSNF